MTITVRRLVWLASVATALAAPVPAGAALTAVRIRIGDHPAFVRVVVDLRGGGRVTRNGSELIGSTDILASGRQRVQIAQPGVRTRAAAVRREGVAASIAQGRGRITLTVRGRRRRFKLVALFTLRSPERVVVDLYKAAPPAPAAVVRDDGCLQLTRFSVTRGRVAIVGRLLRPIFENQFAVAVRDVHGLVLVRRTVAAFPGLAWRVRLAYRVHRRQAGTVEAFDLSQADGRLTCLVQDRAVLRP